jgi:hypothetical protein
VGAGGAALTFAQAATETSAATSRLLHSRRVTRVSSNAFSIVVAYWVTARSPLIKELSGLDSLPAPLSNLRTQSALMHRSDDNRSAEPNQLDDSLVLLIFRHESFSDSLTIVDAFIALFISIGLHSLTKVSFAIPDEAISK